MGIEDVPELKGKVVISRLMLFWIILGVAFLVFYATSEYNRYTASYAKDATQDAAIKELKEVLLPAVIRDVDERIEYFAGPEGRTDRKIARLQEEIDQLKVHHDK